MARDEFYQRWSRTKSLGLSCNKCGGYFEENVGSAETPAILDRTCGIVYEWSSMDTRWYQVGTIEDLPPHLRIPNEPNL